MILFNSEAQAVLYGNAGTVKHQHHPSLLKKSAINTRLDAVFLKGIFDLAVLLGPTFSETNSTLLNRENALYCSGHTKKQVEYSGIKLRCFVVCGFLIISGQQLSEGGIRPMPYQRLL